MLVMDPDMIIRDSFSEWGRVYGAGARGPHSRSREAAVPSAGQPVGTALLGPHPGPLLARARPARPSCRHPP